MAGQSKNEEKLYIFTKNHEGKKEVYSEDSYLRRFMKSQT